MTRGPARRLVVAGVGGGLAVPAALTAVVAVLGPSAMEPRLGGPGGWPPYSLAAHPAPGLVAALAAAPGITRAAAPGLAPPAAPPPPPPPPPLAPSPRPLLAAGLP